MLNANVESETSRFCIQSWAAQTDMVQWWLASLGHDKRVLWECGHSKKHWYYHVLCCYIMVKEVWSLEAMTSWSWRTQKQHYHQMHPLKAYPQTNQWLYVLKCTHSLLFMCPQAMPSMSQLAFACLLLKPKLIYINGVKAIFQRDMDYWRH